MKIFGYGYQNITEDDIATVTAVLRSDYLTQGPKHEEFESAICRYTGSKYCVAVSSATAALHIAMLAAGVKNGDEVITTPNTFVASANCARYVGADVAFVDIDSTTANIDVNKISVNDKTKVIIPVHFAGQSCDMEAIQKLAGKSGAVVIEDASPVVIVFTG